MPRPTSTLTQLAKVGFAELSEARERLDRLSIESGIDPNTLVDAFAFAADPDSALGYFIELLRRDPHTLNTLIVDSVVRDRLVRVLGASTGLGEFFVRHSEHLNALATLPVVLPGVDEYRRRALAAVNATDGFAGLAGEEGWNALRVQYRRDLAQIAAWDLEQRDPVMGLDAVARALADIAAAALDASLAVARTTLSTKGHGLWYHPHEVVARTQLGIIGMGKAGAGELNYISDVDVIFVGGSSEESIVPLSQAIEIGTRLAMLTARGISEAEIEPGLWEVDANLRPEGKAGALVRSLDSHLAYYERWAKSWEFQALLKARPLAGDLELSERYVEAVAPLVWSSAARENFVESVQRMRERVTEHIKPDEINVQLKLGPGGLRDIEFTVQLLQLVHGRTDELVRQRATVQALDALADRGYIGRAEWGEFVADYRLLRLLEHRIQLRHLQRTHLMPTDEFSQRILARSSGLAGNATELIERWQGVKARVRSLHERLFYRPLLAAVANLSVADHALTSVQAEDRLAAIGFIDPRGALSHIAAMTAGVSRKATIQRNLMPVMLQWFAQGVDPDYGLLAFRRLSDSVGDSYWFLRMLRDSSGAAARLTHILSVSRYVGELLEKFPEAAAWLENDEDLRPRPLASLIDEMTSTVTRHDSPDAAAAVLRTARRRELLRLAISSILGLCSPPELGKALSEITMVHLQGVLAVIRQSAAPTTGDGIEFAIIAMGRFGGAEMGFGSDTDIMYVYRCTRVDASTGQSVANFIVREIKRLTEDSKLPFDLDIGLRPEGKNGVVVRSLDSYRAYYQRWSLTWEAQALLRARGVAGDVALIEDFESLADDIRYPHSIAEKEVREVKRIKARVEGERLPQGADPTRHLKLGRGSISDVEWLVQLLQLEKGRDIPALRTTSTLFALQAAEDAALLRPDDAGKLRSAWALASRARSAVTLWYNKPGDLLPVERIALEGVARILEYPPGSASELEEEYLALTRRSRAVFERLFYEVNPGSNS